MNTLRNVFIVVAGGNYAADRHFDDTIKNKRTVDEIRRFLPESEIENLESIYHNLPFIVWGSVPGPMNETRWDKMRPGDIILIYNKGYIRYVGEIAAKVRSRDLAKYFWKENEQGSTWELIYFITNEKHVNVSIDKLNPLLGYQIHFTPQGTSMIETKKTEQFTKQYGDIVGVLLNLEQGDEIHARPEATNELQEEIEKSPTEHDELQWRLIRLGKLAQRDVWIPRNDQHRQYDGEHFSDHVLHEFHESMDVPLTIKNIDVVWKFGPYSIDSAFEIEHSTSIYSGILRLSDLRAQTPNSQFPLFIVAPEDRKRKVFEQLRRPTFSSPCLKLHEVVRFISYNKIRELDESLSVNDPFEIEQILQNSLSIS